MSRWDRVRRWPTSARCVAAGCGLLVGALTALSRWYVRAGAAPIFWNDSADYVAAAKLPLLGADRLVGTRPVLMPLVLSMASLDLNRLVLFHAVIASCCWGLLGAAVAASVRTWPARMVGVVGVLALASMWTVSMWDQEVLTESLALSGLALCIAAAIWFANRPSPVRAVFLVASCSVWLLARDSHAIPIALAGLALGLLAWRARGDRRRLLAVTAAYLLALTFLVGASANAGQRNVLPLEHVYAVRVFPFPERVAWFEARGMPQAKELAALPLATDPARDIAAYTPIAPGPQWATWRDWLRHHGQATFVRYVATHPAYLVTETQARPERVFNNGDGLPTYEPLDRRGIVGADWVGSLKTEAVIFLSALAILGLLALQAERRRLAVVGAFALATALPHALAVWHLDGMESARHLLIPGVQARIGCLLLVTALVDAAWAIRGTGRFPLARSTDRPRAPSPDPA